MTESGFSSEVLVEFPEAKISIDDGESLRFRVDGLDCGGRRLATGRWSVEVRDLRNKSFDDADDIGEDDLEERELVVPTLRRLFDQMLFR